MTDNTKNSLFRNKFSFFTIGIFHGLSAITTLADQFFMKDTLKLGPAAMSSIQSTTNIPKLAKPLFGFLSDFFPICGYKRKIYLFINSILIMVSWFVLSYFCNNVTSFIFLFILISIGTSFISVLGEAIVIELGNLEEDSEKKSKASKSNMSLYAIFMGIGTLATAYLKGELVELMDVRKVFLIGAFLPLLVILAGIVLKDSNQAKSNSQELLTKNNNSIEVENENNINSNQNEEVHHLKDEMEVFFKDEHSRMNMFKKFLRYIRFKKIFIPVTFIFIHSLMPQYYSVLFYFMSNDLHLDAGKQGVLSLIANSVCLFWTIMYKICFKNLSFKVVFIGSVVACNVFTAGVWAVSMGLNRGFLNDFAALTITHSFMYSFKELQMMPIVTLCSQLSPEGLEAIVYSYFMSIIQLGNMFGGYLSAILIKFFEISSNDFVYFPDYILTCLGCGFIPALFLLLIPSKYLKPLIY